MTARPIPSLQVAYDASLSPEITLDATRGALTLIDNATPVGNLLEVQNNAGANFFSVSPTDISLGQAARRWGRLEQLDVTGGYGVELFPDDFTRATLTGTQFASFFTQAGRTITLNIPGGGGVGNDTAPAGMNFAHTVRFEDTGFLFAAQLLINAAVQVECATNTVGPLYLFLDQYKTYADTNSATCTQHNTIRAQPSWGPNINGGSITQTSAQLFFCAATVDATVGSASITQLDYFTLNNVTLTAGGTITTFNGISILDISGPTTIRGIQSLMNNGTFINHVGTAPSNFGGAITMSAGAGAQDWQLSYLAANIATLADGDSLRITTGGMFFGSAGSVNIGSSVANRLDLGAGDSFLITATGSLQFGGTVAQITTPVADNMRIRAERLSIGATDPGGTEEWFLAFTPPAQTTEAVAVDHARILFSPGAPITVDHAITNLSGFLINEPAITIGTGSVVDAANVRIQLAPGAGTNRYGLLITSNPSGGTLNYALRCTLGDARFDGRTDINNGIALGGGAAPTLGTIGGSGPTTAAQAQWVEIDIGGTAHWIAVWT